MNVQKLETLPPPPGIFNALKVGFNVVSSRAVLILLPVIVDLFLWLGPRLSVGNIYTGILAQWIDLSKQAGISVQDLQLLTERVDSINRINVLSWLRTFPIGIPSLLSGVLPDSLPLRTPFGLQDVIQVSSLFSMLGWLMLLTLIGWIGGSLYFRWVSESTLGEDEAGISPLRAIIQSVILSVACMFVLMVIFMPVLLILSVLMMISPIVANGIVFVILLFAFWLIVPFFFMSHGIFTRKQNAFHSVLASMKLARFALPTSSLFVFAVFILSTGLNYLWAVPPSDSWMLLVGIAGHAFITTALLSASFVYYHDMNHWLEDMQERFQKRN